MTNHAHYRNTRKALLCMSSLIAALVLLGGFSIVLIAHQQNSAEARQSLFYATKATESRTRSAERDVIDYAFWGDAYQHLHASLDLDWAYTRANMGRSMYDAMGYDGVFVIGPDGSTRYALVAGEMVNTTAEQWLEQDISAFVEAARDREEDQEAVAHYLRIGNQLALGTAAALTDGDDPDVITIEGPSSVLLFFEKLDPDTLQALGTDYGINNLRQASAQADNGDSMLALPVLGGDSLHLEWDLNRTGTRMLMWLMPILLVAAGVFGYLTRFNLRVSLAAARRLDARTEEASRLQAQLAHFANHDDLTGLPNRALLDERLQQACVAAQRTGRQLAVMLIDLDGFKPINDNFSHHLGDQLLVEVARRMSLLMRPGDTVARMGGDEFIVILPNLIGEDDAAAIAERIITEIAHPYRLEETDLRVTASVGIVMSDGRVEQPKQLMHHADLAMYKAKQEGRNAFQWYSNNLDNRACEITTLRNDLQQALEHDGFELYYQPQISADSGHVIGVEALLRWNHPQQGFIPPTQFIPISETTGQIIPLSQWVLDTACRQIAELNQGRSAPVSVAVNISPIFLLRGNFCALVQDALQTHQLAPHLLALEITEGVLLTNADRAIETLHQLNTLGVEVAIDDFGTGFSSLSYLKILPVHKIKIDRSFVSEVDSNAEDAALTHGIISMARHLGRRVNAEGVETEAQKQFLSTCQCDEYQGYLFSKPLPFNEIKQYLDNYSEETARSHRRQSAPQGKA
ncbi:MAG: putative bifunctional diguanylate cyclase/phosphodiesterase [Pseudomonas sp.]